MTEIQKMLIIYFVAINVATFFTFGIDKWKAKRAKWRIREAALLILAILVGAGGYYVMGIRAVEPGNTDPVEVSIPNRTCASRTPKSACS